MKLAEVFGAIAHKRLSRVDISTQRAPGLGSNQHEINAGAAMRRFFGPYVSGRESDRLAITWIRLVEDDEPEILEATVRLYDSRYDNPDRSAEWRLHYDGEPLAGAEAGDHAVFLRTRDGRLFGLVVATGSEWHDELERMLGITLARESLPLGEQPRLPSIDLPDVALETRTLGPRQRMLLEQLDIDVDDAPVPTSDQDIVLEAFGDGDDWPGGAAMVELAHRHSDVIDHPDDQLLAWLEREHALFRALERLRIGERLLEGFATGGGDADVDAFLQFSLSVQNRRKQRMGASLEGHLASLFSRAGLRFDTQERTEGRRTPDFLFPGIAEYRMLEAGDPRLVMLAAKSTCKDRWRQILNEAAKIPTKHLCTLQPAISTHQLDEMQEEGVVLVIPARDHGAFQPSDRRRLWTVAAFIEEVRTTQQRGDAWRS